MLSNICKRGFPKDRIENIPEPKIKRDDNGYFIQSVSEGIKVYLEDYYSFLEELWDRTVPIYREVQNQLDDTPETSMEAKAYYRSRKLIMEVVLSTIKKFYTTADSLGIFMSPWCFGTVILEKVEAAKDKIRDGEEVKHDVGD